MVGERDCNGKWIRGSSGNPGGRPAARIVSGALLRQSAARVRGPGGKRMPRLEALLLRLWHAAIAEGDTKAAQAICDRLEGKVGVRAGEVDPEVIPILVDFALPPLASDAPATPAQPTEGGGS